MQGIRARLNRANETIRNSKFARLLSETVAWPLHATSALPVWLWSTDGSRRILWANPVGAGPLFGAGTA